MRGLFATVCIILVVFAGVQYNDPDYYFWMPVYAVPALFAAVAACSPRWLRATPWRILIALCTVLALAGSVWFWPTEAGFWQQDVWWNSEMAREGMGMMTVAGAMALIAFSAFRPRTGR